MGFVLFLIIIINVFTTLGRGAGLSPPLSCPPTLYPKKISADAESGTRLRQTNPHVRMPDTTSSRNDPKCGITVRPGSPLVKTEGTCPTCLLLGAAAESANEPSSSKHREQTLECERPRFHPCLWRLCVSRCFHLQLNGLRLPPPESPPEPCEGKCLSPTPFSRAEGTRETDSGGEETAE